MWVSRGFPPFCDDVGDMTEEDEDDDDEDESGLFGLVRADG